MHSVLLQVERGLSTSVVFVLGYAFRERHEIINHRIDNLATSPIPMKAPEQLQIL